MALESAIVATTRCTSLSFTFGARFLLLAIALLGRLRFSSRLRPANCRLVTLFSAPLALAIEEKTELQVVFFIFSFAVLAFSLALVAES